MLTDGLLDIWAEELKQIKPGWTQHEIDELIAAARKGIRLPLLAQTAEGQELEMRVLKKGSWEKPE